MTEVILALCVGISLSVGIYLGQRSGTAFARTQIELAGQTAEKMAQILVAPYGIRPVEQTPQISQDLFEDITNDEERLPAWMEDEDAQTAQAT